MANYINLQETECDTTAVRLHETHNTCCQDMEELSRQIQALSDTDGGFYVEKISEKITELLSMLEDYREFFLREAFEDSEKVMEEFLKKVMETDVM